MRKRESGCYLLWWRLGSVYRDVVPVSVFVRVCTVADDTLYHLHVELNSLTADAD